PPHSGARRRPRRPTRFPYTTLFRSRSSSSATMTIRPSRMSWIADSTESNGMPSSPADRLTALHCAGPGGTREMVHDELPDHVALEIHGIAWPQVAERRVVPGIGDEGDARHVGGRQLLNRQAHAIDADRAVQHGGLRDGIRQADVEDDMLALRVDSE